MDEKQAAQRQEAAIRIRQNLIKVNRLLDDLSFDTEFLEDCIYEQAILDDYVCSVKKAIQANTEPILFSSLRVIARGEMPEKGSA